VGDFFLAVQLLKKKNLLPNFQNQGYIGNLCPIATRARIFKSLRSPEIDSEETIPPAYVAWWASTTNRVVLLVRRTANRFLGSLKGLQIRSQVHKILNL
jgi:hypothetical protein